MLPPNWCGDSQERPDSNMTCQENDYLTIPEKCVLIAICGTHSGLVYSGLIYRFLNDNLRLRLASNKTGPFNAKVKIWEVELALAEMTAAMFWSGMCVNISPPNLDHLTLSGM